MVKTRLQAVRLSQHMRMDSHASTICTGLQQGAALAAACNCSLAQRCQLHRMLLCLLHSSQVISLMQRDRLHSG